MHLKSDTINYLFGFNGKENDNEVKGDGNQQDYGMRIYDQRLGRFLSVDPLTKDYAFYSPFQFSGNSPIENIDLDGLEPLKNGYVTQEMREGKTKLKKPESKIWGTLERSLNVQKEEREKRLVPLLKTYGTVEKAIDAKSKEINTINQKAKVNEEDYQNMLKSTEPDPGDPGTGLTIVRLMKTIKYEKTKSHLNTELKNVQLALSDLKMKNSDESLKTEKK